MASDSGASNKVRNFAHRCQDSALIQREASLKFCAGYHPHKTATHAIRGFPNKVMVMVKRTVVRQLILVK